MNICIVSLLFFIVLLQTQIKAQKIFSTPYSSQADLKVYVVKYESQADLKVFKVDFESQATGNEGLWYFVNNNPGLIKKFSLLIISHKQI